MDAPFADPFEEGCGRIEAVLGALLDELDLPFEDLEFLPEDFLELVPFEEEELLLLADFDFVVGIKKHLLVKSKY